MSLKPSPRNLPHLPRPSTGFSLIELMIAMTIGLAFSLAVMQVLSVSETRRRTSNSVNDIDQVGAYAMFQLDKFVRAAGSGFASIHSTATGSNFGCKLNANLSTAAAPAILPAPTLPAPFDHVLADIGGKIRLAPILIDYNGSNFGTGNSDVLIVMSGSAGYGEGPMTFANVPVSGQLNVRNTYGFTTTGSTVGDLLLVVDQNTGGNVQPCMIEQVLAGFSATPGATALTLSGDYYTASGTDPTSLLLTAFSINGQVMDLGNPAVGNNPPLFQLIGVKEGSSTTNYALYSYDLLNISNPGAAVVISDQVFEMHALYYVDTDGDGKADAWVSPKLAITTTVGGVQYDAADLMAGTPAAADALYNIKAIRLGLILRSPLNEQSSPGLTTLTLFSGVTNPAGTSLTITRTLAASEQNYRYRVLEATIPIRNNLY